MRLSHFWLLAPHALSTAGFLGALGWMMAKDSNQTPLDLNLAVAAFAALAVAIATTVAGIVVVFRRGLKRQWPWLLVYLVALVLPLILASGWFATHLV
jgi:hypothetical protein